MFVQLLIGAVLLVITIVVSGVSFGLMEWRLGQRRAWLTRAPHRPKLMLVLIISALWIMAQMTLAVWIWSVAMLALGIFDALEPAVYFALVAFTTLGFGDVLLPVEWRLLGGIAAANGLLNIGFVTAAMVEVLRQLRIAQMAASDDAS